MLGKGDARYSHRMGEKTVKLVGADGSPIKNKEVSVKQVNSEVLFGTAMFGSLPYANNELQGKDKEITDEIFDRFFELFNYATLPFYWGRFEPQKGKPDTERVKVAAKWLKSKGIDLKGHPLCWHTVCADWLLDMNNKEIFDTQIKRIHRDVTEFAGLIDKWDVINEVVIMPIFDKYDNAITRICKDMGRIRLVREVFKAARESNPGATLLINDFETSESYDILIEGCLESGIKFDAIGIQSHMHQGYWGVEKTQEILERFSRFNLPIHFTENTIVSGKIMPPEIVDLNDYQVDSWPSTPEGEERQAREVATHYKTLFSHPLIQSVTWWDMVDGGWLKAPAGLVHEDGSIKPAYTELKKLIKDEWWTKPWNSSTDDSGNIKVSGFKGVYEVSMGASKAKFTLNGDGKEIKVTF